MAKSKTIGIVATVLSVLALAGVAASAVVLNKQVKTVELNGWDYKVATLDEEGNVDESKANVVTKKFITVDGLDIQIADEAEITYQVFFYDNDQAFISNTEAMSSDFDGTAPEGAEYAKILITHEEDDEITFFEKFDYVKQIEVEFKK